MSSGGAKRVVIVSRIFSPEPSAASFILEATAIAFRDAGHRVTVITTTPPAGLTINDPDGIIVRRAGVKRDREGYVRGYLSYLSFDIPLFFRLLFRRADLYFVEPPPTTGAVVRVVAALRRRPYVYDAADLWSDAASMVTSSKIVLGLLRFVERFALRGAKHAFAISNGLIARMREIGVSTPATPTGHGADAASFRFDPPSDPSGAPYFIYAGSYSEWHGADIFVEAFARFSAIHTGYRLKFFGHGSERPKLIALTEKLGLSNVEFHEPTAPVVLNQLLNGATASLASLRPGQGYDYAFTTKVFSSISAGCPVIFTGTGPTVAFVRDAAHAHSIGEAVEYDVDELVDALERIAAAPRSMEERKKLSNWARANFSNERIGTMVAETCAKFGLV